MAAVSYRAPAAPPARYPTDALIGMAVYNGWTRQERRYWHEIAGSCCPADAVEAWLHSALERL